MLTFFKQQCQINFRQYPRLLLALCFFSFIIFIWPIIGELSSEQLSHQAPGIIWLAALFAQCLHLANYFSDDYKSGLLECYCLSPQSQSLLLLLRLLSSSLIVLIPLILAALFAAFLYQMPLTDSFVLCLSLLLALPILDLLGALLSALLLNTRQGSLLLMLLILPLYVPIVILATSSLTALHAGISIVASLSLLAAILCLSLVLFPPLIAYGLRIAIES